MLKIFSETTTFFNVKYRKREPEGVHVQLEGCNRKLWPKAAVAKVWPKAAVAKVYTHGKGTAGTGLPAFITGF